MTYYSNNKAALAIQFFSCIAVTVKWYTQASLYGQELYKRLFENKDN